MPSLAGPELEKLLSQFKPVLSQKKDDCWNACVASLTDIPYDEIPFPPRESPGFWIKLKDGIAVDTIATHRVYRWRRFFRERGYKMTITHRKVKFPHIAILAPKVPFSEVRLLHAVVKPDADTDIIWCPNFGLIDSEIDARMPEWVFSLKPTSKVILEKI